MNEIETLEKESGQSWTWEKQQAESALHFSWFHTFLMLGESRSIVAAYNAVRAQKAHISPFRPSQSASGAWKTAADKWRWRERAQAWDAQQRRELESRKARERIEQEKELDARLFQIRVRAITKIEQMLDFPIIQVTTESADGKHITVEPSRWNQNSMVRLLEAVIKMGQQNETEITIKGKNLESGAVAFRAQSAKDLSHDELMAIARSGGYRHNEDDTKETEKDE